MGFVSKLPNERGYEILGVVLLALTFFLFFALVSHDYQGQFALDDFANAPNLCGRPGAYVAGFLYVLFGNASHVLYAMTCIWALMLFGHKPVDRLPLRLFGLVLVMSSTAALLQITTSEIGELPGGAIGGYAASILLPAFLRIGSSVIAVTLGVVGILLATEFLFVTAIHAIYSLVLRSGVTLQEAATTWHGGKRPGQTSLAARVIRGSGLTTLTGKTKWPQVAEATPAEAFVVEPEKPVEEKRDLDRIRIVTQPAIEAPVQDEITFDAAAAEAEREESAYVDCPSPQDALPALAAMMNPGDGAGASGSPSDEVTVAAPVLIEGVEFAKRRAPRATPQRAPMPRRKVAEIDELPPDYVYPRRYTRPSLDMLDPPPPSRAPEGLADQLRKTSLLLEKALETFGIEARVTDVTRGPTITRFELEPAPGIKVSRFTSLADDLALALKAHGVRVEAPIPGKGRVGIELPNVDREAVVIRELLESRSVRRNKGCLVLALGKDIAGEPVAADLTTMPHLLIAGATGTGKTVCVKSLLGSLLFSYTPEQLQLMLVDPKMVELSIFNDIPHLITPVVTDPKKAAAALHWLIVEMEERYRLFAQLRVRNIEVYNESVENGEIEMPDADGEASGDTVNVVRKLPYIVCVIDELADLMMLARAEVEDAIMRLAQLARAVGIHLIIATQRPSVNVLTGVIKANFPVRISFQVSSRVDSRCILDEMGAERLIGRGDMLYLPAGRSTPTRIQGAFVSDREMESLISYLKTQAPPQYRDEIESFGKTAEQLEDLVNESDELFDDAVRVVLETGQASISMVQRRLRVGYTRAARLIDMMEVRGIVGPHLGSKAREILVDFVPADRSA